MTLLFSLHRPPNLAHIHLHSSIVKNTRVTPRLLERWVNSQVCLTKIRTRAFIMTAILIWLLVGVPTYNTAHLHEFEQSPTLIEN